LLKPTVLLYNEPTVLAHAGSNWAKQEQNNATKWQKTKLGEAATRPVRLNIPYICGPGIKIDVMGLFGGKTFL